MARLQRAVFGLEGEQFLARALQRRLLVLRRTLGPFCGRLLLNELATRCCQLPLGPLGLLAKRLRLAPGPWPPSPAQRLPDPALGGEARPIRLHLSPLNQAE